MASLILLIIFGLGMAYFATQNTGSVHLLFGSYLFTGIPLYMVVIGSLLLGVFISWLISFVNTFSFFFSMHGKETALKKSQERVEDLEEQNHQLEVEIAQLSGEKHTTQDKEAASPSLSHTIKQHFGMSH